MRDTSPIDALEEYLDRWAAAHLSCEPADRRRRRKASALPTLRRAWRRRSASSGAAGRSRSPRTWPLPHRTTPSAPT